MTKKLVGYGSGTIQTNLKKNGSGFRGAVFVGGLPSFAVAPSKIRLKLVEMMRCVCREASAQSDKRIRERGGGSAEDAMPLPAWTTRQPRQPQLASGAPTGVNGDLNASVAEEAPPEV
jgi:hypothetical protein